MKFILRDVSPNAAPDDKSKLSALPLSEAASSIVSLVHEIQGLLASECFTLHSDIPLKNECSPTQFPSLITEEKVNALKRMLLKANEALLSTNDLFSKFPIAIFGSLPSSIDTGKRLIASALDSLNQCKDAPPCHFETANTEFKAQFQNLFEQLISQLLIGVQGLKAVMDEDNEQSVYANILAYPNIVVLHNFYRKLFRLFKPRSIVQLLKDILKLIERAPQGDINQASAACTLLLESLSMFVQYEHALLWFFHAFMKFHRVACKATYILISLFGTLYTKGYCIPEQEAQQQEGAVQDNQSGTGLGEGEGRSEIKYCFTWFFVFLH